MKIQKWFFSEEQIKILRECQIENQEDNFQWITKNVVTPLIIIFFPLLIHFIFVTDVKDINTLIFNGSISLIGINILFGMSTYLIKIEKTNRKLNTFNDGDKKLDVEEKLNQDKIYLRSRLDDYKNILVFIGGGLYIFQALYYNYSSNLLFYSFLIITIVTFSLSIYIGRNMFIIKDDFFERTYYKEINSPIAVNRKRWDSKY